MEELIFKDFKVAVQRQFNKMKSQKLFVVDIDKDALWDAYLKGFPKGTNNMFRERNEYDCQSCKSFVKACGDVVSVIDNKLISIWDIEINGVYKKVASKLSELVKSKPIVDAFLYFKKSAGSDYNVQMLDDGENTIRWEHFFLELPDTAVAPEIKIGSLLADLRTNKEMFLKSMESISLASAETCIDLIEQNSLYRGMEHKNIVDVFVREKIAFDTVPDEEINNYCWITSRRLGVVSKIKNLAIGTLLVDISNDVQLDDAVRMFESKVAPENYKRPTAVITKRMIGDAQKKVAELGIENSLQRRFAVVDDITVNNVLFANRESKKSMGVFDVLNSEVAVDQKNLSKVEEIGVDKFVSDILPNVDTVELMFENNHINNLMSLIAPINADAKLIFKWRNNFSWSYNGEVADSIKERVKKAGGNVGGVLRCSLGWFNYDDLDIHVIEPKGNKIFYGSKGPHLSSGKLDVDMNVHGNGSRSAVENIVWTNKSKMQEGEYVLRVNNYTPREHTNVGFDVEIEYDGDIHRFHYDRRLRGMIDIARFTFSKKCGIEFVKTISSTSAKKTAWGISTQQFHKVSMIMNSPNHWDDHKIGNRHMFFILDQCKNDKTARGFFNEFLGDELSKHRKVFEVLGSKLRVRKSDNQLSGLGFSSTKSSSVLCKLSGSFSRIIKINF